jgi:ABC-type uncharacterized transport system YnjBCD substrate-binding protein
MAITMTMWWQGVTKEQYDVARKTVNWETDAPKGAIFHVAAFKDGDLYVTDIWESAEDFAHFQENRLAAGVQKASIQGQPRVVIADVHAIFSPGYTPKK